MAPILLGVFLVIMYVRETRQPRQTDSFAGLFLVAGVPLIALGAFVTVFGCLLLTRRLWSRVVYTGMIGLSVLAVFVGGVIYAFQAAMYDHKFHPGSFIHTMASGGAVFGLPSAVLVATIVLAWRPQSRAFFTDGVVPVTPWERPYCRDR